MGFFLQVRLVFEQNIISPLKMLTQDIISPLRTLYARGKLGSKAKCGFSSDDYDLSPALPDYTDYNDSDYQPADHSYFSDAYITMTMVTNTSFKTAYCRLDTSC